MAILACGFRAFQGLRLWFLGCCLGFVEKLQPIVFIAFFRRFHGAEQQPKPSSPPLSLSYSPPRRPMNPHTVKAPCSHPSAMGTANMKKIWTTFGVGLVLAGLILNQGWSLRADFNAGQSSLQAQIAELRGG